jgi:glycosyltransferase involved in cell wall biosynthesis
MTDRPLRFCMITTFYPPYHFGGDGIFVYQLSHELAQRGHQVEVIHCLDAYHLLSSQDPIGSFEDHPNVTVHRLKSRFGFLSPLATQQTGIPFFKSSRIKEILRKGFDVVHYHNISLVGGPKILEYGEGIKLYTIHEYWLLCPTHILFKSNRSVCTRPHCLPCGLLYKRPPQWWRYVGLLESAVRYVNAFIAPSKFTKDIHHHLGLNLPIVHLPSFISEATAISTDQACEEPYFLFVGRLEKLKGLQTLIPIFRQYRKAKLLVAGKGGYETRLRQLAKGCDNIHFLGHLPAHQLQTLYRNAVALIVPSICYEIFSLVTIEAFRQQTPVILRNLGGMPELIEESGGGFVYHTEEELIVAMDKLLEDSSCRNELGRRGYEAYLQNWTAEIHLKRYFSLINEIATASGKPLD